MKLELLYAFAYWNIVSGLQLWLKEIFKMSFSEHCVMHDRF